MCGFVNCIEKCSRVQINQKFVSIMYRNLTFNGFLCSSPAFFNISRCAITGDFGTDDCGSVDFQQILLRGC